MCLRFSDFCNGQRPERISLLASVMHPNYNYRHSRRSACDRCRGQKLRCERNLLNGMSCERCLKAQEICTTSVNQPGPVMLPNQGQSLVPRDRESDILPHGRESSSVHKMSGPKVKKPTQPTPSTGKREDYSYWGGSTSMPLHPGGNVIPSTANNGLDMSFDFTNVLIPFDQWGDQHIPWSSDSHHFVSYMRKSSVLFTEP